ncbi:putative LRR receptor-like serine/threonine-protein kinase, partial [Mucuna pruriens]
MVDRMMLLIRYSVMPALRIHGYALAVSFCFIILIAASQRTHPSEVNALRNIKKSLIDPKDNLRNWNKGDPCARNWTGVWCFDKKGDDGYFHVREIYLMTMNLSGSLSPQLGQLSHLEILDFMWNNLIGTIPKEIGNITSLIFLLLNGNKLSGSLPDELGNLSNLNRFQVDENQLSGPIPESFANMINVKHLHMNNNSFSGQLPSSLSKLPKLIHLLVDNNNLSGHLPPEFSMLHWLEILQLDNNNFSGNGIPSTYTNLTRLVKLQDGHCIGRVLGKSCCVICPIIVSTDRFLEASHILIFKTCEKILSNLSLANNLLSGPIPASIWQNMSFSGKDKLTIDLHNNSFSNVQGNLNPPSNVTLRLSANPICKNSSIQSIGQYCGPEGDKAGQDSTNSTNSSTGCPVQACPVDEFYEYALSSSVPCYCAAPLRIGYRLKSPILIDPEKRKISVGIIVAAVVAAAACVLAISATITLLVSRRNMKYQHKFSRKRKRLKCLFLYAASNIPIKIDGMKSFTYKELALATSKFNISTKVGQGGYGNVYKGILSDETFVAVKRAEEGSLQGQKEFLTEIELLSRLHHRNLVSLIGYCNEEGEQMLVYDFMPNGTLRDWISGKSKKTKGSLNFSVRLNIAMGAAKGILYLHTEANPPIFHRDIKASNILLDSKFTAKVADFGLSRLVPYEDEEGTAPKYVSTVVKGTPGYLDPEYLLTHKLTDKSDVYSLGIVFLELLTGMQPISHGKNIVREVNMARQSGTIYSIIDSRMGLYPSDCLDQFLSLALSCCQDNPEERPSMLDVVRKLEDIIAMLPETETLFSDVSLDSSSNMAPSSSASASGSHVTREEQHMSSYVSGSDLVSDVIPTIVPR